MTRMEYLALVAALLAITAFAWLTAAREGNPAAAPIPPHVCDPADRPTLLCNGTRL